MITHRILISGLISLVTVCGLCPLAASAAGELVQSWRTDDGWLTELRVHPNGAKVCSTGKAAYTPHTFGLTFVRSGSENVVLLVDEQQPPTDTSGADMTFEQSDKTLAALKMQVAGPAWAPVSAMNMSMMVLADDDSTSPLLRSHSNGTIEADHFAVEHFVLEDVTNQRGIFGRAAKT